MLVSLCGVGVSPLTLLVVHYLKEADFNLMGLYANGIIPAGALLVGVGSGLGFALASRYLQIGLTPKYVIGMIFTGIVTYWCAQYETYLYAIEKVGVLPAQYGFGEYLRDICEQMTFGSKNPAVEPKPLGKSATSSSC